VFDFCSFCKYFSLDFEIFSKLVIKPKVYFMFKTENDNKNQSIIKLSILTRFITACILLNEYSLVCNIFDIN
jgi:hypothetical protein